MTFEDKVKLIIIKSEMRKIFIELSAKLKGQIISPDDPFCEEIWDE